MYPIDLIFNLKILYFFIKSVFGTCKLSRKCEKNGSCDQLLKNIFYGKNVNQTTKIRI